MDKRKIALLVDVDNVKIGKDALNELFEKLAVMGDVVFCKFYGYNDRKHLYLSDIIAKYGYETVPFMRDKKRYSQLDNRIIVDAIDLIRTNAEINADCIVAGDGDLSACLAKLRSCGKYLIDINTPYSGGNEHLFQEHLYIAAMSAEAELYQPKTKKVSVPKIKKEKPAPKKAEPAPAPKKTYVPEDIESYIDDEILEGEDDILDREVTRRLNDITVRTSRLDFSSDENTAEKLALIKDIETLLSDEYAKGNGTNSSNPDVRQIFKELEELVEDMKSTLN